MWQDVLNDAWQVWLQVDSVRRFLNRLKRWDTQPLVSLSHQAPVFPKLEKNKFFVYPLYPKVPLKTRVWFWNHGILEVGALVTIGYLYSPWETGLCYHCRDLCCSGAHPLWVMVKEEGLFLGKSSLRKDRGSYCSISKTEEDLRQGELFQLEFLMRWRKLKLVEPKGSNLLIQETKKCGT